MQYNRVQLNMLENTCVGITKCEWDKFMKDAKRADKRKIDRLVKRDLPDLYHDLALNFYNPYNYFKTDRHIIVVSSAIEHFITYTLR